MSQPSTEKRARTPRLPGRLSSPGPRGGGIGAAVVLGLGLGAMALAGCGGSESDSASAKEAHVEQQTATAAARAKLVHLRTLPSLHPPRITIDQRAARTAPGFVFLGPKKVFGPKPVPGSQQGPEIVDNSGRVRFFRALSGNQGVADVRVQRYQGKPVLTWWQGRMVKGHGFGTGMILDSRYHTIAKVRGGEGLEPDLHEFELTPRGTALFTAYKAVSADLSSVGGKKQDKLLDSYVQEVDIATGKVLFTWDAREHVPLSDSYESIKKRYQGLWDFFHINSVSETTDGNLIVSARHTWTVYKINRKTGEIMWQLGGKHSDFEIGAGANFAWQHDARNPSENVIQLFNNDAASKPVRPYSGGLRITIDPQAKTARLIKEYVRTKKVSSGTQGNTQLLPDGHVFVGWGSQGKFTEFAADGKQLFDGDVPEHYDSYRAYRAEWTGTPTSRPRAVARRTSGTRATVYASWNGSTEVVRWQVLAGRSPHALHRVASARWRGLETAIAARTSQPYVQVRALNSAGDVLSRSRVVKVARRG